MRSGAVAEVVPFEVELYAYFSAVCSLWERDATPFYFTEEIPESLHHPQTWVHVRVSLLLLLSLLYQVSLLELLLHAPPPLSNLLLTSLLCSGIST